MNWKPFLRAKGWLLAIALVWGFLLLFTARGWYQIAITIAAIFVEDLKDYRYGLWIAQDQDVNTILGGNPYITVSSKVGYRAEQGSKTAQAMAKVIDLLFKIAVGQENHCAESIERDEEHY